MHQSRTPWRRVAGVLGAAALVFAACGGSSTSSGGAGKEVTVIGTWAGDEQKNFLAMVAPWEQQTGNKVKYTGTRDINQILTTGVASGVLPDLAGLPGPGQMAQYAQAGALKPLDDVLDMAKYKDETAKALVDLGMVDGKTVGVFIKAAVKGLIWYNPKLHDYAASPPKTWDDLMSQAAANKGNADQTWCVGLESGAASGWPGTDWIEDIVLRSAGPAKYDQWWSGKLKWTSPEIKNAFQEFGKIVDASYGGANTVLTTNFEKGGDPLFKDPPGCEFHHQASFITGLGAFKSLKAGTDYNFFPFPDIDPQYAGAVEVGGDLFGMFRDTPQARALIKYLTTPEAQSIWVKRGGALSPNKKVALDSYPDAIAKQLAQAQTAAKTVRFDAADLMPDAMSTAFNKAILDFIQNPGNLDSILAGLDKTQADAYKK